MITLIVVLVAINVFMGIYRADERKHIHNR
jgi:hypothetical protein